MIRRGPLARLLDRLDAVITARSDRRARAMGLTITRLPGSRNQYYRSAVWDRRRLCDTCGGSGVENARECPACAGQGVVTRGAVHEAGEQR